MSNKFILISLIIATSLSLIVNIIASKIEPYFSGQPHLLIGIFLFLFILTIWYELRNSLKRNNKNTNVIREDTNKITIKPIERSVSILPETVNQTPVPNYSIRQTDVIVNYRLDVLRSTAGRYVSLPRLAGRTGCVFGRVDVFCRATDILLSDTPEPIVLHGLPGIGKSALAAALAWGLAPYYKGGVLWIDKVMNDLSILCDEIGRLYADEGMLTLDPVDKLRRVRHLLNQQPTLVVLDNCGKYDVIQIFAEQCAPLGLIITSRERMPLVGKHFEILPLKIESAKDLFLTVSQLRIEDSNKIEELLSVLSGHPQAITIAGALCMEKRLSPLELHKVLEQAEQRIQRLQLGVESQNSVWASFEACYNRLDSLEQQVFKFLGGAWSKTITAELITYVVGLSDMTEGSRVLKGLVKHALLSEEETSSKIFYRIHDLIQSYSLGLIHEHEQDLNNIRDNWVSGVVKYVSIYARSDSTSHDNLEMELENLLGAAEWAEQHQRWTDTNALVLLLWSCGIMEMRGYAIWGTKLLIGGLSAARKLNKSEDEAIHLTHLAIASYLTGRYNLGEEYAEQALSVTRVIGDRVREETNLMLLGRFQMLHGRSEKSLEFHEQALTIARETGDRIGENSCLGFMALCHWHLGEFKKAIELYNQALCIAKKIGDQANEGRHLSRMASCYVALEEFDTAISLYQSARSIARKINNRVGESFDLGGLGRAYYGLGQYDRAISLYEQALQITNSIGYPEGQIYRSSELAIAFARVGRVDEGLKLAREALDIALRIEHATGEEESRLALAECMYASSDNAQAEIEATRALEVSTISKNRFHKAEALHLLGVYALERGDYKVAYNYLTKELNYREEMEQKQKTMRAKVLLAQLSDQSNRK